MTSHEDIQRTTNPITMTRFLLAEQQKYAPNATGNFVMLLQSIQLACKAIANASKKAGIANLYGIAGGQENKSGDVQKKLDVLSNDIFINALSYSGEVYIMGSEEDEEPIILDDTAGGYGVVFDPLDGSSNIDANVSVGTIFGIYKKDVQSDHKTTVHDILKPGNQLVASGYALYGSATILVLTTGLGVNGFTLDPSLGEFILTHENIQMPTKGKIYSCNEGNYENWAPGVQAYVDHCKSTNGKKAKKARYVGSMVADIHRTLLYGGIFMYPADRKTNKGKLRILYECNPIAHLIEQAGGRAIVGTEGRVMDVQPTALHQRVPIFCGSTDDVTECLSFLEGKLPSKV